MAGSISGTVTNSSGGGLSGITVQASGGGTPASATTNSSGNYQITNLSAGTYNVKPVPAAGTFTPNNYSVALSQNGNVTGKNFQKTGPSKESKESKK